MKQQRVGLGLSGEFSASFSIILPVLDRNPVMSDLSFRTQDSTTDEDITHAYE